MCFKTLEEAGLNVTMEDVANTDHFNIIEQLVDGDYHLTKVQPFTHNHHFFLAFLNIVLVSMINLNRN